MFTCGGRLRACPQYLASEPCDRCRFPSPWPSKTGTVKFFLEPFLIDKIVPDKYRYPGATSTSTTTTSTTTTVWIENDYFDSGFDYFHDVDYFRYDPKISATTTLTPERLLRLLRLLPPRPEDLLLSGIDPKFLS